MCFKWNIKRKKYAYLWKLLLQSRNRTKAKNRFRRPIINWMHLLVSWFVFKFRLLNQVVYKRSVTLYTNFSCTNFLHFSNRSQICSLCLMLLLIYIKVRPYVHWWYTTRTYIVKTSFYETKNNQNHQYDDHINKIKAIEVNRYLKGTEIKKFWNLKIFSYSLHRITTQTSLWENYLTSLFTVRQRSRHK